MVSSCRWPASVFACLFWVVGCGDTSLVTVEGRVTIDGESIEAGSIRFLPRDGRGMTSGGAIQDGAYRIEMLPGPKRVEIRSSRPIGEHTLYPDGPSVPEMKEQIPSAYNQESKLQVDVTSGDLRHDFQLESEL